MNSLEVIKALQLGLDEAIDIIQYYLECEFRSTGVKDPVAVNSLEQLKQLRINSAYIHDTSKLHPIYGN